MISGSGDNTVRMWELSSGVCVHVFDDATSRVSCLALQDNSLLAGAEDSIVRFEFQNCFL